MGIGINASIFTAGTLHSRMKQSELQLKFEQVGRNSKQNEPEKSAKQMQVEQMQRDMVNIREGNQVSALDTKIKAGGELSDEELEYLREKNPELYQKAIEIKRERAQYKKELEACKTKEDVDKLHANKVQRFASEIKTIRANPNIGEGKKLELIEQIMRRFAGVNAELAKFLSSDKGKRLIREACKKDTD